MGESLTIKTVPEATYEAVRISLQGRDIASKEWKNLKRRARRNGYSLPKQVLVDYIKGFAYLCGKRKYKYVLSLSLSCGGKANYKTFDDIPDESVPCPCGNPEHWLIKYEDFRKEVRDG